MSSLNGEYWYDLPIDDVVYLYETAWDPFCRRNKWIRDDMMLENIYRNSFTSPNTLAYALKWGTNQQHKMHLFIKLLTRQVDFKFWNQCNRKKVIVGYYGANEGLEKKCMSYIKQNKENKAWEKIWNLLKTWEQEEV